MGPLLDGIILGLTLAIFFGFGPVLFALLQTTIHRGLGSGVILAIGVFLSDLALVGLCFLGAIQVINKPENNLAFAIISGTILIVFGIVTYTRKAPDAKTENGLKQKKPGPITYLLKGFFLNIANPFVWIFWVGVVVSFTVEYDAKVNSLIIIFGSALLTVLITDILKCFASYKIKRLLTQKIMQRINHVAGIGLVLFGVFLILRGFLEF